VPLWSSSWRVLGAQAAGTVTKPLEPVPEPLLVKARFRLETAAQRFQPDADKIMAETVSDHVVAILQEWGVDTVFGLLGDGINGLVEAFRKAKKRIRYVHCRHGETAALAACAHAKFSGRPGVCFSTTAPGAVDLLNGLYDAKIITI
jgi:TPP-dependent trihydroxycyclohexane-1,2-dione (THcHDO) dehydratase